MDKTNEIPVETHPLAPFLPENAKLLMLGSFPPQSKRWSMNFYYPNIQNDMWRIFGIIFFDNKHHFLNNDRKLFEKEKIVEFITGKGIAIFDTATQIKRLQDNASDKFLEVVTPTDIPALLAQIPGCRAIVTTGQKATDTLCRQFDITEPKVGSYSSFNLQGEIYRLYRMPSSSRAYPLNIEKKAEIYRSMFNDLNIL